MAPDRKSFLQHNLETKRMVQDYLQSKAETYAGLLSVPHLREAVLCYVQHGGKCLRAQVLLLCCGIVGGREESALPAAAAVEAFHGWTLIHDDIIDQDDTRRGRPTIHAEYRQRAIGEWRLHDQDARHYGHCVAILAGDVLQGWVVSLLCDLYRTREADPELVIRVVDELNLRVRSALIDGEMLDVQFSQVPLDRPGPDSVSEMICKKTGCLYEFAGRAGAMIGLGIPDPSHPQIKALASFTGRCGVAFQLQDDLLGVIGNQRLLGKPTDSDLRLGKHTLVIDYALKQATESQRERLLRVLGNREAAPEEIGEVKSLLQELGAIAYAQGLAKSHLDQAMSELEIFPPSRHKELLSLWATFLVEREL